MTSTKKYKNPKRVHFIMEQSEHDLAVMFAKKIGSNITDLLTDNLWINMKSKMDSKEIEKALQGILDKKGETEE